MNHLLERQIKNYFSNNIPNSVEFKDFINSVSDTYNNFDKDRELLERSFDISSKEFLEMNSKISKLVEELNIEKQSIEKKVSERTIELTIANERLTELDKVKSEFISVAAHQLRTPLSAIKWTLSLLIEDNSVNLSSEQLDLLKKGYESNEHIINLINDMLLVTRIESGKIIFNPTMVHIEDLIQSVLLEFEGKKNIQDIEIQFEKPAGTLPYVNIDTEKMRWVIQNLVDNALNYTHQKGIITIKAYEENEMIKVSISDNGIGIPLHQQSSIFSKFFRADNATKFQTSGSGLGLFIVKNTIDMHGGSVYFESVLGEGTTFYFTIPKAKIDENKSE